MARWLVKEEPTHYGWDEFAKDGKTTWSGVKNALAQKHLSGMRKGDEVFYYHTGDEKAVVGIARVAEGPAPDSEDPAGKRVAVVLVPIKKLPAPVALSIIKGDPALAAMPLVRIGRLSVMPVTDAEWRRIVELARSSV